MTYESVFNLIIAACGIGVAATIFWFFKLSREAKRKWDQESDESEK